LAAPSEVVIASGDCRDPDLINITRELNDTLAKTHGTHWLSPEDVSAKLAPAPTRSVEEIQRQYDAGLNAFYAGEYSKAEELLSGARAELVQLPPGGPRVTLMASVNLAYALVWMNNRRYAQADEAFRQVLRLAPNYVLDPVYFSPETRARFNKVRRELARAPKLRLTVKSLPAGAVVSLDGHSEGKTPVTLDLPAASYELQLTREGVRSFPRTVKLSSELSVTIDLGFEGSVDVQRVPCIRARPGEKDRLASASRLGGVLGADEAVVLRIDHAPDGPSWLTAALLGLPGGQKVREGSLKIADPSRAPEGLPDLATFLQTGRVGGGVVTGRPDPEAAPLPAVTTAALTPKTDPGAGPLEVHHPKAWRRPVGLGVAAGGAVAAVVGAVFEVSAASTWSDFDAHYANGSAPQPSELPALAELRDSARSKQTLGAAGLVVGAVGLGVGAYLYFTAPRDAGALSAGLQLGASDGAFSMVVP